jgi:hypothetical protein
LGGELAQNAVFSLQNGIPATMVKKAAPAEMSVCGEEMLLMSRFYCSNAGRADYADSHHN